MRLRFVQMAAALLLAAHLAAGSVSAQQQVVMSGAEGVPQGPIVYEGEPGNYFDGVEGGPGCDTCDASCGHYIYTRAEIMFLRRDDPDGVDFATLGENGPVVLSSEDIDFEEEAFSRFVIGVPLSDCCAIEATYFGLDEFRDEVVATSNPGNIFSVFSDFEGLGFGDVEASSLQSLEYVSRLNNAELNFLHYLPGHCNHKYGLLAGLRYFKLEEALDYNTLSLTDQSFTRVRTDNDLMGMQLGAIYSYQVSCKFSIGLEAKAGVYVNEAEQSTVSDATVRGTFDEKVEDDNIALVSDGGLTGTYDVCSWLSLRGGYHVLFVSDVALADENFNTTRPASVRRLAELDTEGDVFYHGATAGAEIRW